jgi:uncharacterized protein
MSIWQTQAPPSSEATPKAPISATERIVALDFIRGIAVLGILFANITAFAHPTLAYYWPGALPGGGTAVDQAVWLFQFVFVDGKFRGLFTLLFGASLYLFLERAGVENGFSLQMRRLFWLLLFGVAHFALLFVGDILFSYAIAGFVALPMVKWTARTQLWVGLGWYLFAALLLTGIMGSQAALEADPAFRTKPAMAEQWEIMEEGARSQIAEAEQARQVYVDGSFVDIVRYRLVEQGGTLGLAALIVLMETVPLLLIGMALYRLGFFTAALDRARTRRWSWIGLIAGALGSAALGAWTLAAGFPFYLTQFTFNGASTLPRLPMILGLAGLLVLATPAAAPGWLGRRIIAAGRMAFSNYIATSVLMMLLFQGWAGGLFGLLSRAELLPFVLIGWVAMLAWSVPWLARFRYGPLEGLWRCLTYWRLFDFRRQPLATASKSH